MWRRPSRAVRNSTLQVLLIKSSTDDIDVECLVAAARCIGAFFAEVKHNTSIVDADLDLTMGGNSW
jgi:hypothetical protein